MRGTVFGRKGILAGTLFFAFASAPNVFAERGGWADPPGGWTFVEEWNSEIPDGADIEGAKWQHNNGSDSYSGNVNTQELMDLGVEIAPGVPVGEVVRIETIPGEGDTEDGTNKAADAKVLRLVDVGDPRVLQLVDPSDRKIFFTGPLHKAGDLTEDPFVKGITFIARFRIFPIYPDPDIGASQDLVKLALDPDGDGVQDGDGSLRFIPEASDRSHVGVGYVDPANDLDRALVGVGFYNQGTLEILVNDESEVAGQTGTGFRDGDENVPIITGIDTTKFHTVWVNAKVDAANPGAITVRAFADGGKTATVGTILRHDGAAAAPDRPNPETMGGTEWTDVKQLAFNIGSAGTSAAGAFQFDYMCATLAGAFDPSGSISTDVGHWELF